MLFLSIIVIFLKKNWERVGFVITVHVYSIMDSVAYNLKKKKAHCVTYNIFHMEPFSCTGLF